MLKLPADLKQELGMKYLFVSDDLVRLLGERVIIMRAGWIVEHAEQVLSAPQEQYTHDLLAAVPRFAAPA